VNHFTRIDDWVL